MKGIRSIELFANIKANIVAFISIGMFVALGMGLFTGIEWGADALSLAIEQAIVDNNMHDIEVSFPYGITDDDLAKLKKVEGVSKVETGYTAFATMQDGSSSYTLKMHSLPKDINAFGSVEGKLPKRKGEIALLANWAEEHELAIGDKIVLKHDAVSKTDEDGVEFFNADTFTITALVNNPLYLEKLSDSFGVSNTASGIIDCPGFMVEDSFDVSKFNDGYPIVFITCESLAGLSTFDAAYAEQSQPILDAITELGGTLGSVRYQKLHGDAQEKIDDAQHKLEDGEQQIEDGKKKLADGEQQIEDGKKELEEGEKKLVDGAAEGASKQQEAQTQLDDAYRQLADGQAKYDAGVQTYNETVSLLDQITDSFASEEGSYDTLQTSTNEAYGLIDEADSALSDVESRLDTYESNPTNENWSEVESAYGDLASILNRLDGTVDTAEDAGNIVSSTTGIPVTMSDPGLSSVPRTTSPGTARSDTRAASNALNSTSNALGSLSNSTITIGGVTIALSDIPGGIRLLEEELAQTKADLDAAKVELDAGWNEYYAAKAEYDRQVAEGQAELTSGQKKIDEGRETISEKQKELEEGRQTLSEKEQELEDGKKDFADAKEQFDKMVEYEWVVSSRLDNGGIRGVVTVCKMMNSVKWAMALLFVLVGLFVCYSAVSRLVHEQIIQVGTKKALGFRTGEILRHYLYFSGLAVCLGILVSLLIAVLLVQGVMNPVAGNQFNVPSYPPYVGIMDVVVMGVVELVLILLSTWIAVHGMCKRNAIDLLRGETTGSAKERFYERWGIWQRMSLFSQTVVNNCVNDTRRVVATLIGVVGCTALVVVAVTLQGNVDESLRLHYKDVYSYDAVTYLEKESKQVADEVALALYERGIASAPAFSRMMQVRKQDGARDVTRLVVPTNEEAFKKFFRVNSVEGGPAPVEDGGLWCCSSWAEHMGAKVGDEIVLTDFEGKTHTFTIAGFFDYYLLRYEFVLSQQDYQKAFGAIPEPNELLTNMDGADFDSTRDMLAKVDGFNMLVNDYENASYAYNEMKDMLITVVLVYLILSALMAVVVLLNLDIMFVSEKKRELIVLMICGFSVKQAKAYIYRDSIALTIIGIVIGVLLGATMGGITVGAMEPELGFWIKSFNWSAAITGILVSGVLSAVMLIVSLRRIPRFDLTDINRF